MLLLLFLLALPIFLVFLRQKQHRKNEKTHLPPGPPGLPLIGNLHQLQNSALPQHLYLHQLSKYYGPLMFLKLGCVPTLIISSARMAKEVLKNHDLEFSGRPTRLALQKLSYNQLDIALSPVNEYWREMRKICIIHLFSAKMVHSFRHVREDEVSRMISKISDHAASSKLANLSELALSLSTTVLCRVAFGRRYDEEGEEYKLHRLLKEAQAVMVGGVFSDYFRLMGWVDRLTGMRARLDKNFKDLDLFFQELIDDHLKPNNGPRPREKDILDILLQLEKDNSASIRLTMDHIKAVLMDLFLAGSDTGASAIIWTMTALIKNPRPLKKLQEEVRKVVGKKSMVSDDEVQQLPYLKAVIKEALRLFPPAPLLVAHETVGRCIINEFEIQPKTQVYFNAWAIGRDPEVWESSEEFLPERFLDRDVNYLGGQDFGFIPFGAGRRSCPGMNLGLAGVELAVANLVHVFDWELPEGTKKEDIDTQMLPGLTMHKKNALCLMAKKDY